MAWASEHKRFRMPVGSECQFRECFDFLQFLDVIFDDYIIPYSEEASIKKKRD